MLEALGQRGPDSAGLALFGPGSPRFEVCRIRLPEDRDQEEASAEALARLTPVSRVRRHSLSGGMVRVELERTAPTADFCQQIETRESGLEIVSLGRHLELVKQVGAPSNVSRVFDAPGFIGSHGIGHTRLSTESRVDLSHSQPFWARGVPDLATVHNGHITNYDRLRRRYEQQGVRFFTENDSEVIGLYLADQLGRGRSLEQAIAASLQDLDGSFTYLVATPDMLGYARDPFALKPLITVETDSYIAIANEEIAIRSALGNAGTAHEPSGNVYRIWRRPALVAAAVT
ncbi:MAG: glutamine phosphoribosylpyrophosphate amidotransferase [Chloroflexi bacterium]|nr:glutamine phosphoribosylpyrophosphate amidotransferase [Chloroflexota bacterium]